MSMLPKEHGAYGQLTFPLLTALIAAGVSAAGLLIGVAAIAGFLAHEPLMVLLGQRGRRAQRETGRLARAWLACFLLVGVPAAVGAVILMAPASRVWLAVPLVPAILLAIATFARREKTWYGEVAAATAFSGLAVPIAVAAGTPAPAALSIAIPFAVLFIASTLAVRAVILRVRGGGVNIGAAQVTRRATFAFSVLTTIAILAGVSASWWPPRALVASAPGLIAALYLAAFPPPPTRLRTVGWTLVTLSFATAAIVIVGN